MKAVVTQIAAADIPLIGPFTGAELLRTPLQRNIFNIRASYYQEIEELVDHLVNDLDVRDIAVFVQDDAFGKAGEDGVILALNRRHMQIKARGTYPRNTVDVDEGLEVILKASPEAVIIVGAYKASAAFARKAVARGLRAKFLSVSFIGTSSFIKEAVEQGEGVVISQVVPSPWDMSIPVVADYHRDMAAAGELRFGYVSFEGYIAACVLVQALRRAGPDLSRDALRQALESMSANLGGFKVSFNPQNHSGIGQVWLTVVRGGKALPTTRLMSWQFGSDAADKSLRGGWFLRDPFMFTKTERQHTILTGLDIELFRTFTERAGYRVSMDHVDWKHHLYDLQTGMRDVAVGVRYTEETAEYAYYSVPYREEKDVLYLPADQARHYAFDDAEAMVSMFAAQQFRLGVVDGHQYAVEVINRYIADSANSHLIHKVRDDYQNFRNLEDGLIDGFLIDRISGATIASKGGWRDRVEEYPLVFSTDLHLVFSKTTVSPETVAEFNRAILAVKNTGQYRQTVHTYLFPVIAACSGYF
jgi:branched-chain amino acid transport system substrate-binding protein